MDDVVVPGNVDLADQLAVASRLTPILYEKFRGNPRRIKRFLNDLNIRQSVADRRGIKMPSHAVAKLMVLERLLPSDFQLVLGWLAQNKLRDQFEALDQAANSAHVAEAPVPGDEKGKAVPKQGASASIPAENAAVKTDDAFSDTLVRWAKLPPKLDATDVTGYLYLAASFAGIGIVDEGLPERLRTRERAHVVASYGQELHHRCFADRAYYARHAPPDRASRSPDPGPAINPDVLS